MKKSKNKTRYCEVCGEKMVILTKEGQVEFVDFEGEKVFYSRTFSSNTGKLMRLLRCPNWAITSRKWYTFLSFDRTNRHDSCVVE